MKKVVFAGIFGLFVASVYSLMQPVMHRGQKSATVVHARIKAGAMATQLQRLSNERKSDLFFVDADEPFGSAMVVPPKFASSIEHAQAFVKKAEQRKVPVVATNYDIAGVDLPDYFIVNTGDLRVAVLGVWSKESAGILPADITLREVGDSVAQTVARLQKDGLTLFVVLSYQRFEDDVELAKKVPGLDLVVSHFESKFLRSQDPSADGSYPIQLKSPNKLPVLLVSSPDPKDGVEYYGRLEMLINYTGTPVGWRGGLTSGVMTAESTR